MSSRPDHRDFGPGPYVLGVRFKPGPRSYTPGVPAQAPPLPRGYPFLPVIHDLPAFRPSGPVTIVTGDNGAGKSTLIEAVAITAGFSAHGGELPLRLDQQATREERAVADRLELILGRHRPRSGFFLRAESFFNVAAGIDAMDRQELYGGRALHAQSHGESFLALAEHRFGADGLFIFDEPEAALSVTGQLAFMAMMQRAAAAGSQFILATHSPILLSYPDAIVYAASERGLEAIEAEDTDPVRLTRGFLAAPEQFLRHLADDGG
jgi:predicted ATPase